MYVRLAFSVAAHLEPEILFVDEVLAVGDVAFQKKCLGKMGDVAKEGRTVLFVSHNMNAILNLCERVLLIENGEVFFFGNTQQAVDIYLSSSNNLQYGNADLSSHTGRAAGMSVIAQSIGLYTSKSSQEYSEVATSGDDLSFRIHYDCGEHSLDLIQLGISTLMGQRVFTIGTHLCPDFHDTLRGRGVIECYLPNVRLTAGEYNVTVMMGKRMPSRNIDYIDNALRFRIEDGNYFGTGLAPLPSQGNLAQRSEWRVETEQ
jgi:lipopolysaccharide transport system ATP-binding protein